LKKYEEDYEKVLHEKSDKFESINHWMRTIKPIKTTTKGTGVSKSILK